MCEVCFLGLLPVPCRRSWDVRSHILLFVMRSGMCVLFCR